MTTLSSKIVFLDIDGVMIAGPQVLVDRSSAFHRIFPTTTVAVMNELCKRTEAKIVFNTTHNQTWENVPDIEVALVNHGLNASHIHPTDFKTKYPNIPRDEAIQDWLSRHEEVGNLWAAIDDALCADDFHMIWVDPEAGVHIGHLNKAIEILGGNPVLMLF